MDTDTCDWIARHIVHIVHLQLPLVMYSKNAHKNQKDVQQNIVKNIRDNQRNRHLKYYL